VKALFSRTAACDEELSFLEGQFICVQSKQPNGVDDGWWIGESNGNTGLFPSMLVEELTPDAIFVSYLRSKTFYAADLMGHVTGLIHSSLC